MAKIISYNVNGIRAAVKKGLIDWVKTENPDILCIQESKAQISQIPQLEFEQLGYKCFCFSAQKKGYSGVAIFTKTQADFHEYGMKNPKYDNEGRVIRCDYGDTTLLNIYFPSGSREESRQKFKMEFQDNIYNYINELKTTRPNLIVCGDFNICHTEIDIHNPKRQQKTSGFLPEERAWLSKFLGNGFLDSFRLFNSEPHNYSWWSYRAAARQKNLGWRIDYFMLSETIKDRIKSASILPQVFHSDHCPVSVEIEIGN